MHEDDGPASEAGPAATTGMAERWRLPALEALKSWTPVQRWVRFAAAVEARHLAPFVRAAPKRRDRGQDLAAGAPDIGRIPARLVHGDLTWAGGQGVAAEIGRRHADAPVEPYRPNLRRRGPSYRADVEADQPGSAFRPAVARRPVAADAPGGETGGRAGSQPIEEHLPAGVLRGLARTLDPHVQSYLTRLLDLRIPAVRIHTGQAADATARRYDADAVSFGPDVMFRAGRFTPESATGLALLGHELTHVAQTESGRSAGSLDRAAVARDELAALENEQRVLRHLAGKLPAAAPRAAVPRQPASRASSNPPAPRAASIDRGVAPPVDSGSPAPPAELSAQQLGALKEAIYRDLMDRIRTEFERGA